MTDLTEADRARVLAKSALFDPPAVVLPDGRRDLVGMDRTDLAAEMAAIQQPAFRV
ncbi:MAG: 23S rRNA (adenine(2503)-C(2))-methyltransferase RlmN, partial [Rhodopila sp.]